MNSLFDDDAPIDDLAEESDAHVSPDKEDAVARTPASSTKIFGHQDIIRQLLTLIGQGRLPPACIFAGPRGVGKATTAFHLTKKLFSLPPEDDGGLFGVSLPASPPDLSRLEVDPAHPVHRQLVIGAHPDFLYLGQDKDPAAIDSGKSGVISVEAARTVSDFLRLKSARDGGWRVVLIDNAETLNRNAQNALLKILEEPPVRTCLILVTHQLGSILPTIRSRCRMFEFMPLDDTDYRQCLEYVGCDISESDSKLVHLLSEGCPGQTLKLQAADGLQLFREFLALWGAWPNQDDQAWGRFSEIIGGAKQDIQFKTLAHLWQLWVGLAATASADPRRRAKLASILAHPATVRMIDDLPLARWLEICEQLPMHFNKTMLASLERRQSILSARDLMRM